MEYIVKSRILIDGVEYLPNRDGRADSIDEKVIAAFREELLRSGVIVPKPEEKPTAKNKGKD